MTFSRDELVAALQSARLAPRETPESITVPEVAEALGVGEAKARQLVRRAVKDGVLEAGRVTRLNICGSYQSVYGYTLRKRPEPS